jgi:outer membrane receptor protein involved in Fe transport
VIKRVSGASIQDDRFAIIRGLNDRYNAAFINGAPLPSTESDRKAFAFDIFPSSILDNLIIYKTATPDKSGEFAGGIIDITTKSIPAKSFTSIGFGLGFNDLTTGRKYISSENRGKYDWLGIDDGSRAIPDGVPSSDVVKNMTFSERGDLAKSFNRFKWGFRESSALPNMNFQFSKGLNIERNDKEFFGGLFSITYNKNFTFNAGERNTYDFDLTAPLNSELIQKGNYRDSLYNNETVLAALANVSFKLDNRNSISWKNNLSINTDNRMIKRFGQNDYTADPTFVVRSAVRWFTSNRIFSSQLSGDHMVGKHKTKINWLGAFSKVRREIPNLARTSYAGVFPDLVASPPNGVPSQTSGNGTMFFTNSNENIYSIRADVTQPLTWPGNNPLQLKAGAGYQYRSRFFTSRLLAFAPYQGSDANFDYRLLFAPENEIFIPDHLGKLPSGQAGFMISDGTLSNSDYDASSALTHGYVMADQRFLKKFRLIYGLRVESFLQKLNAVKNLSTVVNINTQVTDLLPSVNLVYSATPKMNLRFCYSKTINRPEFRELAPYLFYDFVTQYTYEGFDTLKRALINNFDFRYEFYPGKAQLFSVSAFYKSFENPIEIVSNPIFDNLAIYSNALSAEVYGVEAEFRTLLSTVMGIKKENSFWNKMTLAANAAYVKSGVKLGGFGFFDPKLLVTDRALQGQSPYLVNTSLGYNDEKLGFSSTLSVNRVGDRIFIAGTVYDADIYERARTVVDFQVAKFFLKERLEVKLNARDLLAQPVRFYFDFDQSRSLTPADRFFSSTNAARVITLSATYKF